MNDENVFSEDQKLLLGIINLNGTDQALTKDQATSMLAILTQFTAAVHPPMPPRGDVSQGAPGFPPPPMPALSAEARAKIDAGLKQIQAVLTPKQVSAIAAMNLTRDSLPVILQKQNLKMGGPGGNPPPGQGGYGQPPQGTPPAGPGRMPGGPGMMPFGLVDALIQQLKTLTGKS